MWWLEQLLEMGMCWLFGQQCLYRPIAKPHLLFLGDVSVGIKCDARVVSDEEEDIDFDIIHNANDTFTVKYAPPAAGRYTIKVLFAGEVCNLCFTA